jgi:hypothetical protein
MQNLSSLIFKKYIFIFLISSWFIITLLVSCKNKDEDIQPIEFEEKPTVLDIEVENIVCGSGVFGSLWFYGGVLRVGGFKYYFRPYELSEKAAQKLERGIIEGTKLKISFKTIQEDGRYDSIPICPEFIGTNVPIYIFDVEYL